MFLAACPMPFAGLARRAGGLDTSRMAPLSLGWYNNRPPVVWSSAPLEVMCYKETSANTIVLPKSTAISPAGPPPPSPLYGETYAGRLNG